MTDKTLFIHAGGTKTGSSALQNFFKINSARFKSFGFAFENCYTYEFDTNNGMLLYKALSSATSTDTEIDSLVLSYFGQCNNAICSSEYFQFTEAPGWRKLLESSDRLGVKLKVIFYFRNIIPFLLSAYDQVIKCHGEWRLFDEWVVQEGWHHAKAPNALQIIADELPAENLHVLPYDRVKGSLLRSFLEILGVDPSFEVDQNEQSRQVNRSLTSEERKSLIAVNKALGEAYSTELSDLLISINPQSRREPVSYDETTAKLLVDRFSDDVDWVNNNFFNGQSVVSVLPIESVKNTLSEKSTTQAACNNDAEKLVLNWALGKLKTIQSETEQRLLNALNDAAKNTSGKSHPDIPADFDLLAYLLLNPDLIRADLDPIQHFILHGRQEGRIYKFS
jgi:hypothetical protein